MDETQELLAKIAELEEIIRARDTTIAGLKAVGFGLVDVFNKIKPLSDELLLLTEAQKSLGEFVQLPDSFDYKLYPKIPEGG